MLDLTDLHPELISSPESSPETQRRRLLMLNRGLGFKATQYLSQHGGGMLGGVVVARGVKQAETQLARNSDAQTLALSSFLRQIMQAVCASDCSDEQFVAAFEDAWAAVSAAFGDGAE